MDDTRNDASISAIRGDQGDDDLDPEYQTEYENAPNAVTESLVFRLVSEGLAEAAFKFRYGLARGLGLGGAAGKALHLELPERTADPQYEVLIHAERTDDGTIGPAADERQQHERHDDRHIEGEAGRQELQLGHPAPPLLPDADQQQCNTDEEDGCERDSDFL